MRSPRLVVLLVLTLLATGCGGHKRTPAAGHGTQAQPSVSPTPPGPGTCPLNGVDPGAGVPANRPVLAVKIDGAVASKAPNGQSGLNAADIVYDEPIEGGFGRFLALFQCSDPAKVGPIREARAEDAGLLQQYGTAIFANAGGPPDVMAMVTATSGILNADSVRHGTAFFRDNAGRQAPYNLFADPAKLRALRVPSQATPLAAPPPQFEFLPAVTPTAAAAESSSPSVSPTASTQTIRLKLGPDLTYQYDPASGTYLRFENGAAHLDDTGSQIRVVNVVIMQTKFDTTQITDPSGTSTAPLPEVTGTGTAEVFTRGVEHDGTWSRPNLTSLMTFMDKKGNPIPFAPGNTWIHILSNEESWFVQ